VQAWVLHLRLCNVQRCTWTWSPKTLLTPAAKCLPTVEHPQQFTVSEQAAGLKVSQQAGHRGLVLGGTQPPARRDLGTIDLVSQGDDAGTGRVTPCQDLPPIVRP
jgi:hypothetical protein